MQDRPTASELLDALGAFMVDRQAHSRDRWERFQFQVVANSLAILKREFEMEDDFMREEWRGLDALLSPEDVPAGRAAFAQRLTERNEALVERIRNGDFDDAAAEDRLVRHLYETVTNKVRIASPQQLSG